MTRREDRPASSLVRTRRPRGLPTERSLRIAALYSEGLERREIAERLGISVNAVSRAVSEVRQARGAK